MNISKETLSIGDLTPHQAYLLAPVLVEIKGTLKKLTKHVKYMRFMVETGDEKSAPIVSKTAEAILDE